MVISITFDPIDFLKLAKSLYNNNDEGSLRTSISRAYYAVFLMCREKIKQKYSNVLQGYEKDHGVHQAVIKALKSLKLYDISDKLDGLRRMRVKADYELSINVNKRDVEKALKLANYIYSHNPIN